MRRRENEAFVVLHPPENNAKSHPYQFMHCYDLLTAHPKWKSNITDTIETVQGSMKGKGMGKGKDKARRNALFSSPSDSVSSRSVDVNLSHDNEGSESRPIGVKAAKRKEKMKRLDDFWASTAKAHDKRYFANQKERKNLKAQHTAVLKEGLQVEKEKNEVTKEIMATRRCEKDDAIITLDTSALEPDQQEYYRMRRTEIMKSMCGDV